MPCYSPLTAYYSRDVNPDTGKRGVTFHRNASFSGIPMKLPCGQCVGCRLERSRQWAVRCVHEKQMHASNVFVTLTYDDKNLPPGGSLVKRDLQLFMKRLRKKRGEGVRFYACGEYGENTFRPHYHAILFNCDFPDKKFFKRADCGDNVYTSAELLSLWPAGHNVIGSVNFDTAAYVARYIMKKVTGDPAQEYYERYDVRTGEIFNLQPEFTNMSRRPGIGSAWFDKFGPHAYNFDSVIINGLEVRPPRFYDTRFEVLDAERLAELKLVRRRKAINLVDSTPERRRVRETVAKAKLALKGRVL